MNIQANKFRMKPGMGDRIVSTHEMFINTDSLQCEYASKCRKCKGGGMGSYPYI